MFKITIVAALMVLGVHSHATPMHSPALIAIVQATVQEYRPASLNWNVGSTADYNLNMGFISGTMHSVVREATAQGFWVQQDMKLGFMGDQKVEFHINKDTGEIIELLVNGQKQTPPDNSQMEIVETRHEKITVPKGEFDSIYAKIRDKSKDEITEVWANPAVVPLGGMLKTIAPGPMGQVTVELTDFKI